MSVPARPFPPVDGVEHRFVDVATGVRLHVAQSGPEAGDPVVLLHGWPQHWYAWRRVIPLLAGRGLRVLAPDLRGFGWSDAPRSSYTKLELAGDIVALLEALDLRDVRLAGHDWGGFAAFLVATRAPERVRSLSAFSINTPWSRGRPTLTGALAVLAYQPLLATPLLGPATQRFTPFVNGLYLLAGRGRIWSAEERQAFAAPFREPARAEAASRVYRSFLTRELRGKPAAESLTVPATLTVGASDPVISGRLIAGFQEGAPGLRIKSMPGGHFLPEEHPEAVAGRIADDGDAAAAPAA